MIHITQSPIFGREVTASKNIYVGQVIERCELLVLSDVDTATLELTDLKYYTFKYNDTQDCLVMGNGEIYNHSDTPNVSFNIVKHDGRDVMEFKSIIDIKQGEQLFTDYNSDVMVDTSQYKNKNMIG